MKTVLLDADYKFNSSSLKNSLDVIKAVTNLRRMQKDISSYINVEVHQNVLKQIGMGIDKQHTDISDQDVIDFNTCQNIGKVQNNLKGLIVKVRNVNQDTKYLDEFEGLIVDLKQDNKNTVRIIPITYDISIASEKSIIVEDSPANLFLNSSKFTKFALLTEFEVSLFLDDLDIKGSKGFFEKDELQKIINFSDLVSAKYLDLNYYNVGSPVVDFFDTRITKRNLFFDDIITFSNTAQKYVLERRDTENVNMQSEEFEKMIYYGSFDAVLKLGGKSSTNKGSKIANDFEGLERILEHAA
jgi:hypothetical protein